MDINYDITIIEVLHSLSYVSYKTDTYVHKYSVWWTWNNCIGLAKNSFG